MAEPPIAQLDAVRADVRRNRRRILGTAADVLGVNPRAGMQDIADAAGLNRATLYRHFANRKELLEAMWWAVLDDVRARYAMLPDTGSALTAIADLIGPFIELSNHYRFLIYRGPAYSQDLKVELEVSSRLLATIARGQGAGEIDPAYHPAFVASVFSHSVLSAVFVAGAGLADPEAAVFQARRAFLKAIGNSEAPQ